MKFLCVIFLASLCLAQQVQYGYIPFAQGNGTSELVANASTTGTTLASLAKKTSSGAVVLGTSDTNISSGVFIVVGGAGTTGNAALALTGQAYCTFASTPTAVGDYVIASTATGGNCSDAGNTKPSGVNIVGVVDSLTAVGSTYLVTVNTDLGSGAYAPSTTVGQDGFWPTGVSATGILGGEASTTFPLTTFYVAQVVLSKSFVVGHTTMYTTTASGATLNSCLYNNASTPALLLSTQTVLVAGTQTTSATQVTIQPGIYWTGFYATGSTAPTIQTYDVSDNITHIVNQNGTRIGTATWSGSTCPTTLTGITANNAFTVYPAVLFEP